MIGMNERYTRIRIRADELAASGRFANCDEIEAALIAEEGNAEPQAVLNNETSRRLLDKACSAAILAGRQLRREWSKD